MRRSSSSPTDRTATSSSAQEIFESIGLIAQVLAMAPPGDARAILSELDWGVVADPRPESVAAALLTIVDAPAESRHAGSGRAI